MELTYHRKGDYLFPNLTIQETEVQIGKYGMLRRTFLKEHRKRSRKQQRRDWKYR